MTVSHTLMGRHFWGMLQTHAMEAGYMMIVFAQPALLVAMGLLVHSGILLRHRLQLLCGQTNFPVPPKRHASYSSNINSNSHDPMNCFSTGFYACQFSFSRLVPQYTLLYKQRPK